MSRVLAAVEELTSQVQAVSQRQEEQRAGLEEFRRERAVAAEEAAAQGGRDRGEEAAQRSVAAASAGHREGEAEGDPPDDTGGLCVGNPSLLCVECV